MSDRYACPTRDGGWLVAGVGVLGESACPTCQGRLFPNEVAERLFDELGVERGLLLELAAQHGGRPLPCPVCGQKLGALPLRGEPAHLCTGCGTLWLPEGALSRLTDGHHVEVPAEAQAERAGVAVLLEERDVEPEVLARAVIGTRLTGVDARQVALRKDGILSLQLKETEADVIVERLGAAGVTARCAVARDLELPPPYELQRVRAEEAQLVGTDSAGKELAVAWDGVLALALGRFKERERVSWRHMEGAQKTRARSRRARTLYGAASAFAQAAYMAGTQRETGAGRALTEDVLLVVAREPERALRLRLSASLWEGLGPGVTKHDLLRALLQTALARSPQATVTGAVRAFVDSADEAGEPEVPTFDDERAFERDLVWTMWRARAE